MDTYLSKTGRRMKRDWMDRLVAKFEITDDGCWQWTGSKLATGYGAFSLSGRNFRVHRLLYELIVERIPRELVVDHLCRNRLCINPDHLEVVTHRENSLRGDMRRVNSERNRARTHCKNGHEYTPETTGWYAPKNARFCRICTNANAARHRARKKQAA